MSDVTWLTQQAHDSLQEELAQRQGPMRKEVSAKIGRASAEGDLKENAGYHAAREEQGQNEARIRQLKALLESARIGVPEAAPDEVAHGKLITVFFEAFEQEETFLLASREEAPHASTDVYSPASPLGQAINGKRIGDSATYTLPNGKPMTVSIRRVEQYGG